MAIAILAGCSGEGAPAPPPSRSAGISAVARAPAASPTAVPEPTSTPVPTATPRPVLHSPLTGLPVDSSEAVTRRPLVVKLGNSEAERPQAGLAQADVVYESVTEGGITRYAAVLQSREATNLGPVRSARLSDLQIVPEFSGVLAHVGASNPIMAMLRSGNVLDLDQFFFQQYYHRTTDRFAPYNVYTSTASLRSGAKDRGFSPAAEVAPYVFQDEAPAEGAARVVDFDFAPETHAQYTYDPARHAYQQIEYGGPTTDSGTHEAVPIGNLVVQFAPVQATNIVEDANGSRSLEYDLVGSGKSLVFHDGLEIEGSWSRKSLTDRTAFFDAQGKPATFARGSVWVAIVKPGTPVTVRPS
jgi:hypothetical protein